MSKEEAWEVMAVEILTDAGLVLRPTIRKAFLFRPGRSLFKSPSKRRSFSDP